MHGSTSRFSGFVHYDEGMVEALRNPSYSYSTASEVLTPTLASLEVPEMALLTALRTGVSGARNVTSFHPVTARGFIQWAETVASLRQALDQNGWKSSDPKNSPRITSPDGRTSIMVIGGNTDTGISQDIMPATARRRGPATETAVRGNGKRLAQRGGILGQRVLDIDIVLDLKRDPMQPQTWVLLYHWATDEPVVRAELSLPISIEDGEIKTWEHRILLPEQGIEDFEISSRPTGSPEDDVDFTILERP